MAGMFTGTFEFNQDISNWDVSSVTNMNEFYQDSTLIEGFWFDFGMFSGAASFNQDISNWDVSNVVSLANMFNDTPLSNENKCAIHSSFSSNETWTYDWSSFCELTTADNLTLPKNLILHQNYPNPFNPTTQIKYDLPENQMVTIAIYDVMGHSIRTLMNVNQTAGYHSIHWDARNDMGEEVSAGMYIFTIQAGEFRATKKMVLLK
tara:strand:- start:103 stop:720 length:618 start_codon:yes stop_codon:yes gene_type:complete